MTTTQTPAPVVSDPADIMRLACGKAIRTHELNPVLTVNHRSFRFGADEGRVILGLEDAIEAVLTSDGRYANLSWHEGPESDDTVYFERWTLEGRRSHGFLDSVSRRIVQTG